MAKDKKSTMGSDLDSYTRRKIAEIDEPRYAKLRKQLESSERPVGGTYLEPRSLKDSAKVMGYGALGAYGVGPATVVDGGINALNAAGDAVSKAKKEVGSRLGKGIPKAVEAVGKAGKAGKDFFSERNEQAKAAAATLDKIDARRRAQSAADREKRDFEKSEKAKRAAQSKSSEDVVKKAQGGSVGSASRRADGCAIRGKTRGRVS